MRESKKKIGLGLTLLLVLIISGCGGEKAQRLLTYKAFLKLISHLKKIYPQSPK